MFSLCLKKKQLPLFGGTARTVIRCNSFLFLGTIHTNLALAQTVLMDGA